MTNALRRLFLPCFCPAAVSDGGGAPAVTTTMTTKKRLSTSLRDDNNPQDSSNDNDNDQDSPSSSPPPESIFFFFNPSSSACAPAQPRPSKSMVIGTIFGHRRGHVWFCIQHDRLSLKPLVLLEFPIVTHRLVNEMRFGLVRIALECDRSDIGSCPLQSVPVWTMFCNGRKLGFALRRKANDQVKLMLKTMSSTTVGAGVMPIGSGSGLVSEEVIMYMRASYEHMVGSADSESFHLINPDGCPSQELSVFLLRSRNGITR